MKNHLDNLEKRHQYVDVVYSFDLASHMDSKAYSAGEHCWVPMNVDDIRIYTRIYE